MSEKLLGTSLINGRQRNCDAKLWLGEPLQKATPELWWMPQQISQWDRIWRSGAKTDTVKDSEQHTFSDTACPHLSKIMKTCCSITSFECNRVLIPSYSARFAWLNIQKAQRLVDLIPTTLCSSVSYSPLNHLITLWAETHWDGPSVMNRFTPETASRLTESPIQLSLWWKQPCWGRKRQTASWRRVTVGWSVFSIQEAGWKSQDRDTFPVCSRMSSALPILTSLCVCVLTRVCVSHPDDCRCVALPWRTQGCRRWRCAADGAEASWRGRCTGAGRSACCGRWGGGRSSWRALKHNNCQHQQRLCSCITNLQKPTSGTKQISTLIFFKPLQCVLPLEHMLCGQALFKATDLYLTFKSKSRRFQKYQTSG